MPLPTLGVFDSGLGGLTGYRSLRSLLPDHPLVYFGDTARVPYGTRPEEEIRRFARQDVRFLLSRFVSAVLVACGTVSSVALEDLRQTFGLPIVGVVGPAAETACRIASAGNGKILVLGTEATVRSRSFESAVLALDPRLTVRQQACPLFVPLAENLRVRRGDPAATAAAHAYLDPYRDYRPDAVILGCTHFPLLADIISDVLPGPVCISAGEEAAKRMAEDALRLLPDAVPGRKPAAERFFTSGDPASFARDASVYLGRKIRSAARVDIDSF
ncbi:MAG: glutamate racemase [Clostridia bacterium]|nr:glutamate racemase [Clostridia bacterium]